MALSITVECYYAECRLYKVSIILSVTNKPIMQSAIKLDAAKQSTFMLSVIVLIVVALRSEPIYMSSSEVRRQGCDCLRVTDTFEFTNQMLVLKYSLE